MMTNMKKFVFALAVVFVVSSAAFAADLDLSNMKRSEIVSSIFVKGSTKDISDGYGVTGTMKVNTKFVVAGVLTAMQTSNGGDYKTGDTVEIAGVTLDGGITATAWFSVNKDVDTTLKEISADKLVSAEDLASYFETTVGQYGEVVAKIPAYTKFSVAESWTVVNTAKGDILPGDAYETAANAETTTWWPSQEYWDEVNSVEVTSANMETYLQMEQVEGSVWKLASLKDEAKGKKIRTAAESDLAILVRENGEISDPDVIDEKTTGEIMVARRSDVNNEDGKLFSSVDSLKAAAPVEPTISRQEDGKYEVVFYAGSDKLFLAGSNLFKYAYDKNRAEEITEGSGKVLRSRDGYAIGTMTVYLSAQNTSSGNGGSGGGGGGCNGGFGVLALLLLPIFFQKGKKSN